MKNTRKSATEETRMDRRERAPAAAGHESPRSISLWCKCSRSAANGDLPESGRRINASRASKSGKKEKSAEGNTSSEGVDIVNIAMLKPSVAEPLSPI